MTLLNSILITILLISIFGNAFAKKPKFFETENDTAYILDLTNNLTIRTYLANKTTRYVAGDYDFYRRLTYQANDNYNIGLGFNYKYIGLNLGFKLPFVNEDTKRYGKTRFFDFQSFIYLRKITIDLYCLSHHGYYLASRSMIHTPSPSNIFPQRPDLHVTNIGVNAQYIFNDRRFSFRAAFLQNEFQKKSSGSFIIGAGFHHITVKADSAIVPEDIRHSGYFDTSAFNHSSITSLAVNWGYAHTFVIKRHYFITAALLGGAGVNYSAITTAFKNETNDRLSLHLDAITRLAAGYNSENYFIGAQYINFINRNNSPVKNSWQEFQAGNLKLTFAMRLKFKTNTQNAIDKIENNIKSGLGD